MARMIEALKGGALQPITAAPAASGEPGIVVAPGIPDAVSPVGSAEPEADVYSFIEVGGPARQISGSADVLAVPVPGVSVSRPSPALPTGGITLQLWSAPTRQLAPELTAWHQPEQPQAQQYRALLTQMSETQESGRVLLFTAARATAGTTTALLNLAITACRQEPRRRVVVVDLHWERPALAERLGLSTTPGMREVLDGGTALEQALQATAVPGLQALVAGTTSRALHSAVEAVRWISGWLRERFDLVLLDAPPWDECAELATLLPICDAVYPVATAQDGGSAQKTWQTIVRRGGRLRGVIQRAA